MFQTLSKCWNIVNIVTAYLKLHSSISLKREDCIQWQQQYNQISHKLRCPERNRTVDYKLPSDWPCMALQITDARSQLTVTIITNASFKSVVSEPHRTDTTAFRSRQHKGRQNTKATSVCNTVPAIQLLTYIPQRNTSLQWATHDRMWICSLQALLAA